MNNGWVCAKLGDVCENLDSKRVPITKSKRIAGKYPYYGASGVVDHVNDYLFDEQLLLISEDGANLLARTYPVAFSVSGKVWVNNHAHVLRFAESATLRFVEFYVNYIPLDLFVNGMAQPKLNQKALNSITIPMPPLAEQRRIVDILDEAFAAIATVKANTEKNLQNAHALFASYSSSVFVQWGKSWPQKPLGEVAEFKNGLNFTRSSNGQTVPVVGVGTFQSHYTVPLEELETVTIDGRLARTYEIQQNDILTVRSNGSKDLVGRCMLVPPVNEAVSFSGFVIRIRCHSEEVEPEYLLHFLKSGQTRDRLTQDGGGTSISNINQAKLSTLKVPLPKRNEQIAVAASIDRLKDETERLTSVYQRKLTALDELKTSLLHQAFNGQL